MLRTAAREGATVVTNFQPQWGGPILLAAFRRTVAEHEVPGRGRLIAELEEQVDGSAGIAFGTFFDRRERRSKAAKPSTL